MAKDPAFLFYYQDFLVGTEFMTNEEVGIYIRILCHLADKGKLSKEHMLSICRGYAFTKNIQNKFQVDSDGFYFNERLRLEVEKRRNYAESRRNNAKHDKAYAEHMEDENINENVITNKGLMEEPSLAEVIHYFTESGHKKEMAESFYSYYSAQDWKTTGGMSIKKNWQRKVIGWLNNQKQFDKPTINKGSPDIDLTKQRQEKQREKLELQKIMRQSEKQTGSMNLVASLSKKFNEAN